MKVNISKLNYKIELSKENQSEFDRTFAELKEKMSERTAFVLAIRKIITSNTK
jgi:hypothetical protein